MCALRLAERGAQALVLESELAGASPSRTASRAAAGMLGPLSETLVERASVHPRLLELGIDSLDLWRARADTLGLNAFPARGARLVGFSQGDIGRVHQRAHAFGRELVEQRGEAIIACEAAIDPEAALAALERAIADHRGEVRRGAQVNAISRNQVDLRDGSHERADVIVLATGAWSPALQGASFTPVKGQILEARSDALQPGETMRAPSIYAVGRAPGRIIIGATMEEGRADLSTDAATIDRLLQTARAMHPSLADAQLVRAWAGVRPMSADGAPRIGRVGEAIIAAGHSRNGWLLAPITAEIVCAHAFEEDIQELWAAFDP